VAWVWGLHTYDICLSCESQLGPWWFDDSDFFVSGIHQPTVNTSLTHSRDGSSSQGPKATSTVRWRYSCCYMQPFVQASCTPWFLAGYIHFLGGRAWTTESETGNTGRIWSPA
jgi:hypothetical protein